MMSKVGRKILAGDFVTSTAWKWLAAAGLIIFVLATVNTVFIIALTLDDFVLVLDEYIKGKARETPGVAGWPLKFWGLTMVVWMTYFAWVSLNSLTGWSEKRCPCENCGE